MWQNCVPLHISTIIVFSNACVFALLHVGWTKQVVLSSMVCHMTPSDLLTTSEMNAKYSHPTQLLRDSLLNIHRNAYFLNPYPKVNLTAKTDQKYLSAVVR